MENLVILKDDFESHWIYKTKATTVLKLAELHKSDLKSLLCIQDQSIKQIIKKHIQISVM